VAGLWQNAAVPSREATRSPSASGFKSVWTVLLRPVFFFFYFFLAVYFFFACCIVCVISGRGGIVTAYPRSRSDRPTTRDCASTRLEQTGLED